MNKKHNIIPPEGVSAALALLEESGYEAFLAGGCVRDSLLGLTPKDWDITTNALPEQVLAVFADYRTIPTGLKHGTVTVLADGGPVEITTYRVDGVYSDNRRPDSVSFTASLEEDLARRDFTVNAMAWNSKTGVVDCFGGVEDLKRQIIRCVGAPEQRFGEDALRILRGARFAATLGFMIEEETAKAMTAMRGLLSNVSAERIAGELSKAVVGKGFGTIFLAMPELLTQILPELEAAVGFQQYHDAHIHTVYAHILYAVAAGLSDLVIRLALLLHDVGKPRCFTMDERGEGHFYGHPKMSATMAEEALRRLRFDNAAIERVKLLVLWHDTMIPPEPKAVRRWLSRIGEEALRQLLAVQEADNKAKNSHFGEKKLLQIRATMVCLEQVLAEGQCYTIRDLAINGGDLLALGYPAGPALGQELRRLLDLVVDGELVNERERLLEAVERPN